MQENNVEVLLYAKWGSGTAPEWKENDSDKGKIRFLASSMLGVDFADFLNDRCRFLKKSAASSKPPSRAIDPLALFAERLRDWRGPHWRSS